MATYIEVAAPIGSPNKVKGDLLEQLAVDLLETQNYQVTSQVRFTAMEVDLLCVHRVNRKQIYVECKAYREPLSANVLTNLLGKIDFKGYQEGWLISAGAFGKDAKGFQVEWEQRSTAEAQKLSIYTPERVIEALSRARLVTPVPFASALALLNDEDQIGEWTFLVTPYGRFWVLACLSGGVPQEALVFSARTGKTIQELSLLKKIASTDTSLNTLDFELGFRTANRSNRGNSVLQPLHVVEVQHGESWTDYRPARPEHFVGRGTEQTNLIRFLEAVRDDRSGTRVFAITGDSGMGKSSLIAKLRSRVQNSRYKSRIFIFAVDVRAANGPAYILGALHACLTEAANAGFGTGTADGVKIKSTADPLTGDSVENFLRSLQLRKQVICLVFDQFEELYSKEEHFDVFEVAQRLFVSTIAAQSNLVLGFAWKTDATVQQDHPAYYMWHRLADHRLEINLKRFIHAEASQVITLLEKEIGTNLRSDLRRQLIENSQGYPWLLKKLCIHVYEQMHAGISQMEIIGKSLDVKTLFDRDLQSLAQSERTCLHVIASNAPANWYDILETFDKQVLSSLQNKRLIIRSGDRLNLYWDIFREYVLTGTAPSIPLTYLPSSPSLKTLLAVCKQLQNDKSESHAVIGKRMNLSEKTVGNVVRDLVMFGIAESALSEVRLNPNVQSTETPEILMHLRRVLRNHTLTIDLYRQEQGTSVTNQNVVELLRSINPAAQHREKTWKIYVERMGQWLAATGYLIADQDGWIIKDQGDSFTYSMKGLIPRPSHRDTRSSERIFLADAPPATTVEAFEWLLQNGPQSWSTIKNAGYKNAVRVLRTLRVVRNERERYCIAMSPDISNATSSEIIWSAARKEGALQEAIAYLQIYPSASGRVIGQLLNSRFGRGWTPATVERIGNAMRNWAVWIMMCLDSGQVVHPTKKDKTYVDSSYQQQRLL